VVLGGDKSVGVPRSVEHAWQLRDLLRRRGSALVLGGWANPNADPDRQVDYLSASEFTAEFYLTQIVSHHAFDPVARFLDRSRRRNLALPGVFGVFYYRSANPRTLGALTAFLPVPVEALTREFAAGASPEDVCARTIKALIDAGARHFYVSNLPIGRAQQVLAEIQDRVGVKI
jgi:hypothetical protein